MTYRYLLHHLLEASADTHPDRPALVDGDRTLTHAELESRANRLSHLLRRSGVERGDRVALYLDKSLEAVTSIYAILKAGAAYVPLDVRAPVSRLGYIVRDCGVRVAVTGSRQASRWKALLDDAPDVRALVVPDSETAEEQEPPVPAEVIPGGAAAAMPDDPPGVSVIDSDLAYILYTSGSTGQPKGVMLSHRNGLGFVRWAAEEVAVGPEDRLSSHAPFHFDLSIFDLFAASCAGASVSLVPHATSIFPVEIVRFIERHEITVWYSVPSILSMITEHADLGEGALPSLRVIVFAGEVFPTKYLSRLMRRLPHVELHNWYGPTETNVCTAYRVPEPPEEGAPDIPIGKPIANDETLVVTDDGKRAAPGEVGELLVRGATVMRGYWGDTEKTSQRLVPNPLAGDPHDLVYRTGDLVEELPDGNYRFLGRKDHQIKSRGYRIELGEIEAALYAHPSVVECAVIAVPDELITNRIKAFVSLRDEVGDDELARFCNQRIPKYMIPEAFEVREQLPKTSTGKIDRQSLGAER